MSSVNEPASSSPQLSGSETAATTAQISEMELTSGTDAVPSSDSSSAPTAGGKPTGRKLYVGNIEYSTKKKEIEELFKDYDVKEIEIPTSKHHRGGKNSGFGTKGYVFVEFGESADLDAIILKFTDSEFKGRQIYLRYPKVKDDSAKKSGENTSSDEKVKSDSKKESKKEKKGKDHGSNDGEKPKAEKSSASSALSGDKSTEKSKPKNSKKEKKEKIPFDKLEKSTDTLYLRNLDFSLKQKDLMEFFTQEGESVEWATVPTATIPFQFLKKLKAKGTPIVRKNKGYAFVKFNLAEGETIEDKVAKFNKKVLKDRELLVNVAVDTRHLSSKEKEEIAAEENVSEGGEAAMSESQDSAEVQNSAGSEDSAKKENQIAPAEA